MIRTTVQAHYGVVAMTFDFDPATESTLGDLTRCGYKSRLAEVQRLAAKAVDEVLRYGVHGLLAVAKEFSISAGDRVLMFDGFRCVSGIAGICVASRAAIREQLDCTAAGLREIERRLSATLHRDIRIGYADAARVELVENPQYTA